MWIRPTYVLACICTSATTAVLTRAALARALRFHGRVPCFLDIHVPHVEAIGSAMPSDGSISYDGVAANGNSRLHAGHNYSNVTNSKRAA